MCKSYADPLSLSAWTCFFSALQSAALAVFLAPDLDAWKIHSLFELSGYIFAVSSETPCIWLRPAKRDMNFIQRVNECVRRCREPLVQASTSTCSRGALRWGGLSTRPCLRPSARCSPPPSPLPFAERRCTSEGMRQKQWKRILPSSQNTNIFKIVISQTFITLTINRKK